MSDWACPLFAVLGLRRRSRFTNETISGLVSAWDLRHAHLPSRARFRTSKRPTRRPADLNRYLRFTEIGCQNRRVRQKRELPRRRPIREVSHPRDLRAISTSSEAWRLCLVGVQSRVGDDNGANGVTIDMGQNNAINR